MKHVDVRSALSHPLSIGAVLLLLVNDHVLKEAWPGVVTGKLSDIAGLIFFPLLLLFLVSANGARVRVVWSVLAITGIVFAVIQVWDTAGDVYRVTWGLLQFPFRFLFHGAGAPTPVAHTADPTDLFALPALLVGWWILGRGRDGAVSESVVLG